MTMAGRGSLLVAALLPALGCTPAEVSDALPQACDDYAYAYCQKLEGCAADAIQLRYGSSSTCVTITRTQCELSGDAPSSGQTAATQAACTQALPMWGCGDFVYSQNPPPACQVQTGALPDGAACAVRQQCQSGFCGAAPNQACGTCMPAPGAGSPCAQTGCPSGFSCVGTPPVCQPHALAGQMCGQGVVCDDGLTCVGSTSTVPGVCQAAIETMGTACPFSSSTNACDMNAGLACNEVKNTCQPAKLFPPGGPCGVVAGQWAYCDTGRCVDGNCAAYLLPGAPCQVSAGTNPCISPTACIGPLGAMGTCQYHGAASCQ